MIPRACEREHVEVTLRRFLDAHKVGDFAALRAGYRRNVFCARLHHLQTRRGGFGIDAVYGKRIRGRDNPLGDVT